jgi:hypothetical protein
MELNVFYNKYITALEKALELDHIDHGFLVKDPVFYIDGTIAELQEFDVFLDEVAGKNRFLDKVAYYFDAKSHNFPDIQGKNIEIYKQDIIEDIKLIKKMYSLKD